MQHVTSVFTHIFDYCSFSFAQLSNLESVTFDPQTVHQLFIHIAIRSLVSRSEEEEEEKGPVFSHLRMHLITVKIPPLPHTIHTLVMLY